MRIFITILLLLASGAVLAQDDLPEPDDIYTGTIINDKDLDTYTINLQAGQGIVLHAFTLPDSALDTILVLENAAGEIVAENDDYDYPDSLDSRIVYVVEESGIHTITVDNYTGTTGDYTLTVTYISAEQAGDLLETPPTAELLYTGFMSDTTADAEYTITLAEGDGVIIDAMATINSDLDTYLYLEGPGGVTIAENDDYDYPNTLDSRIVYVAEEAGEYTVIVSNYPGSSGNYELVIEFVSQTQVQNLIEAEGGTPLESTTPLRDPDLEYTGTIVSDEDEDDYVITLQAGQGIIVTAEETDGVMDTMLILRDSTGTDLISNDDRADQSGYNSQLAFIAPEDGEYTIVVTNYPGSPGNYRLAIYYASDDEITRAQQAMRIILSGEMLTYDTDNFRIHYTLDGVDATTLDYVESVAETMEEVLLIQVEQIGWAAPPPDGVMGGDTRYDVYLADLFGIYGYMSSSSPSGDNPNTAFVEENARPAYLVLDNDYDGFDDPYRAMRATAAHEFHHIIQYGYDPDDFQWYLESTASWMETITFPEHEEATIYVEDVFNYPEVCFGGEGFADVTGFGVYGTWLFLEYMQRTYADDVALRLWENIAVYDGWEPLRVTLAEYGETLENAVLGYHLHNLVRDYTFTPSFDNETVWLERTINAPGEAHVTGGVQELAANYLAFDLPAGNYDVRLIDPDPDLEMWAVGIKGEEAAAVPLGVAGTINTTSWENTYIIVFNRAYDEDVGVCEDTDYTVDVQPSTNPAFSATMGYNAGQFRPLR